MSDSNTSSEAVASPSLHFHTVGRVVAARWVAVGIAVALLLHASGTYLRGPQEVGPLICDDNGCAAALAETTDWLALLGFALFYAAMVLLLFLPYTRGHLAEDGTVTFSGGLWPSRRVPLSRIDRLVVGALAFRGLVIFQLNGSSRAFMAGPVDGIADLVAEARRRGAELSLDGV